MKERLIYAEAREDGRRDGLEEGREEGRIIGREEGRMEGRAEGRAGAEAEILIKHVESIMRKLHIDLPEACEVLGCRVEEYDRAKETINSKE